MSWEDTEYNPRDEETFFVINGEEEPMEDVILAKLLLADVLYAGCAKDHQGQDTIGLYVYCSDTFWYSCADGEPVRIADLLGLYRLYRDHNHNGVTLWCCLRRKMRPLPQWETMMRESGCWDDSLDALPSYAERERNRREAVR